MTDAIAIDERYDDVETIRVRDPVAEVLGVRASDEPFEITYGDVVKAAGHSCPTAAGAFRIAGLGLDALYPDTLPVRGDIWVRVGGPRDETAYGVTGRLLSYVTGAAGEDGFGGLPGGFGARRGLLTYESVEGTGVTVELANADAAVAVSYDVASVPPLGEAKRHLPDVVDGSADPAALDEFRTAWHRRVDAVMDNDDYFDVREIDRPG